MKKRIIFLSFLALLSITGCKTIKNNTNEDTTKDISNNTLTESINLENTTTPEIRNEILKSHISYEETKELVKNPGSGFYNIHPFKLTKNGVKDNITWHNDDGFYHLRISLEDFTTKMGGEDIEIPKVALDSLSNHLKKFDDNGATVIIRFAYDGFNNHADVEPDINLILKHISSLGPIVSKYNCVEALECGLIGPWGEMHTSILDTQETYNSIFAKWLESTTRIPILSRKPRYVYRFMGYDITNLETFKYESDDYKRLGVFNDGYLGTKDDTGTYLNREKEIEWMDIFLITPYGGEVINPDYEYTYIPNNIHLEQYKTHLSYLNEEWDYNITNRWKNTTIGDNIPSYTGYNLYNFMNNHMGYGFLLKSLECYKTSDNSYVKLSLDKVGYKKYLNDFKLSLILTNDKKEVLNTYSVNLDKLDLIINIEEEKDSKLYLKIEDNLNRCYKLLNKDLIYEENMNYIGEI